MPDAERHAQATAVLTGEHDVQSDESGSTGRERWWLLRSQSRRLGWAQHLELTVRLVGLCGLRGLRSRRRHAFKVDYLVRECTHTAEVSTLLQRLSTPFSVYLTTPPAEN